jgi:hypothetical protein
MPASIMSYSPLTANAVGPAGPPSKLAVGPHSGPSTALAVTANGPVAENDFQWVQMGLPIPPNVTVNGVVLCYQVLTGKPGSTYISQVRLTSMTTPNVATVKHDDPTNLTSTSPASYTSKVAGLVTSGAITLELKMVFGSKADKILLGSVVLQ